MQVSENKVLWKIHLTGTNKFWFYIARQYSAQYYQRASNGHARSSQKRIFVCNIKRTTVNRSVK
jgi:hypothetical protein